DDERVGDADLACRQPPAVRSGDEERLAGRAGKCARLRARWDQHAHRLHALRGHAGARIDYMRVALAIDYKVALIVAGSADRFTIAQFERGDGTRGARMLYAHAP